MTRSPIALLIIAALCIVALQQAGVVSFALTPWEAHTAHTIAKDAGRAAKAIGVRVNVPPKPPWEAPAKAPATAQATTTVYPTPSGATVAAPSATPSVTAAYCALEQVSAGTDGCP